MNNKEGMDPETGVTAKERASRLAIVTIAFLIAIKVTASFITGSIGLRADAIHSVIDLTGAVIGYIAIKISCRPPDRQHAFGHGKTEDIAGLVIGTLIVAAAVSIVYESVRRLITGGGVEMVTAGIAVTGTATVINVLVSWYIFRVARSTESIALEATARDMLADVMSSVAVFVGLILVRFTGIAVIDPLVAILVSLLIGRAAYTTLRKSVTGLMDTKLPEIEEEAIRAALLRRSGEVLDVHRLRSRRSGEHRYIDLHVVVPKDLSVEKAHDLCDEVESEIKRSLTGADVTIHVEPCMEECDGCEAECPQMEKGDRRRD